MIKMSLQQAPLPRLYELNFLEWLIENRHIHDEQIPLVRKAMETVKEASPVLTFGMHRGKKVGFVIVTDPSYIRWLVKSDWYKNECTDDVLKEALRGFN